MKKNIILFLMTFIVFYGFSAFVSIDNTNDTNSNEEIRLLKTSGGTRSGTVTLNAFINGQTVIISIENYDGIVSVEVSGAGGAAQQSAQLSGSGQMVLDISSFNSGIYTLRIILGNTVYEGSFEKL